MLTRFLPNREAGHQPDGDHGGSVGRFIPRLEYGRTRQSDQPRVGKGGADSRHGDVIGDEYVLHLKNGIQAGQYLRQRRLTEAKDDQCQSEQGRRRQQDRIASRGGAVHSLHLLYKSAVRTYKSNIRPGTVSKTHQRSLSRIFAGFN